MNKRLLFLTFTFVLSTLCGTVAANTLTDVGTGPEPAFDPLYYDPAVNTQKWTLTSSCVDINENGEAACQAVATGPIVRCGFRGSKRCGSVVSHVHKWNGVDFVLMSDINEQNDFPVSMNDLGWIGGYSTNAGGNNGRIWFNPQDRSVKQYSVNFLNNQGDYILSYSGAYYANDMPIAFPGTLLTPTAINDNGEVVGGQVAQAYISGANSPTGNEVPEISGVGWMLSQAVVDALPRDQFGLIDMDGGALWPLTYYRPTLYTDYTTIASDINKYGEFVAKTQFGGLYNGYYCTHEGETTYTDTWGVKHTVPWVCDFTNYMMGTYAGGKAFIGINNVGDAVGTFTPGVYINTPPFPTYPWVWLVNASGGRDEYDANDLLPPGSGYTVLEVKDINDKRDIVGTCLNPAGEKRGCIIHVTDIPVPADTVKPKLRIAAPLADATVSGVVQIDVLAWDRQSRMQKVIFRVDGVLIGKDQNRPYNMEWDTTTVADGLHDIKAVAVDNAGNRRAKTITVNVANTTATPPPAPTPTPTPAPGGSTVDGQGSITEIGTDYIGVDGTTVYYNADTTIKFNDVSGFALDLPVQYSGTIDDQGVITATQIEVN